MIELKLKRAALRLDFSFFAVIALFLLLDTTGFGLMALLACALHELAHMLAMAIFGISADEITFYGAGIRISSARTEFAKPMVKALILSAGCAANFALAVIFWRSAQPEYAAINLFTGIFNLLPIGELDGAGLLNLLLLRVCRAEKIDGIMRTVGAVFSAVCIAVIVFFGRGFSFTLITTVLYFIIVSSRRI